MPSYKYFLFLTCHIEFQIFDCFHLMNSSGIGIENLQLSWMQAELPVKVFLIFSPHFEFNDFACTWYIIKIANLDY